MKQTKITFSNGHSITLNENDCLVPIVYVSNDDESFASMGKSHILELHIHNGLIPSIMSALLGCDFFFVNDNQNIIYGTKSIVSVENI